jgi:cytochrome c biogenesis protein CcdA
VPALALAVVGIALPDSLNPTLIVGALYLALTDHPFRRTLAFTIAAFLVTLAGGLAVALGLGDLVRSLLPKPSPTVKWTVLTVVGAALVGGAAALWWRRDSVTDSDPHAQRAAEHRSEHSGSALVMGASIAGVEFLTAFPYFAAIAMVLGASVSAGGKVFLIVLYNVIYAWPLIAIVVVCGVMGQAGAKRLAPVADWIERRWPIVVAPLIGVVGVALAVYGILQLS